MIQSKMLATNLSYKGLNVAVLFFISVLLSRLTGVAGFGLLSLMIANATIFNLLSAFGADAGIVFYSASGRLSAGKLISFLGAIVFFQLVTLSITELISYSISGHFFLLKTENIAYWWMSPLFLISISLVEKYSAMFNGLQLFSLCNKLLLTGNLFTLTVISLLWLSNIERSPYYYIAAFSLLNFVQAVFLIVTYHLVLKNTFVPERLNKKDALSFFSYSMFTFLINSIQFLAYRVDYWILDHYKGEEELGWYSLAVKISQLFWVAPLLLASIIFPKAADREQLFDESKMLILLRGMNWVNIVAGILLFFMMPFFIPFFFGKQYDHSILLFQLLLPGIILFCMATILAAYFAGQNKLKINLGGSLLCLLVILVMDLLLIPSKGMKGAAIASTVGYSITAVYFVAVYCYSKRISALSLIIPGSNDWKFLVKFFRKPQEKKIA